MAALSSVLAVAAITASVASTAVTLTQKPPKAPALPDVPKAHGEDPADKERMERERADAVTRTRRRASGSPSAGRASTLLTGAGGITSAAPSTRATLLGG